MGRKKGPRPRGKTLQEIEQFDWGEPECDLPLAVEVHALRRKNLDEFTVGDLRLMIRQQVSLPHLVPRALILLKDDPLINAFYYSGDLLLAVLGIRPSFWATYPDLKSTLEEIVSTAESLIEELPSWEQESFRKEFGKALQIFDKPSP